MMLSGFAPGGRRQDGGTMSLARPDGRGVISLECFSMPAASVFLFFSAALCAGLLAHAWHQRRDAFSRYFVGLMTASILYALGYGAELMAPDVQHMIWALRVQYLGIPFIALTWVGMAWAYLDSRGLPRPLQIVLGGVGVAVLLAFQSNDIHRLFYVSLDDVRVDDMSIALAVKGPLYWAHIAFLNLAIAFGVLLFFRAWRQSMRIYRAQSLCLLLGSAFPWLFHLVYLMGGSPHGIDLGPFGLAASGVFFAAAAFRHGILEILPIARDLVFDGISEGVIVLDGAQRVSDFNRAAMSFVRGLGPAAVGRPLDAIDGGDEVVAALRGAQRPSPDKGAGPLVAEMSAGDNGIERHYELRLSPMVDRDGVIQCQSLMLMDITEKRQLLAQLHELATTDSLTGLYNRRQFEQEAGRLYLLAERSATPLSIAVIDVDCFKAINDQQGHAAGDATLRRIADVLKARLRASDVVGRIGGDEFVAVLPGTGAAAAGALMRDVSARCRAECGASLSVGVAERRAEITSFEALSVEGDGLLYRAKHAGRDCVMVVGEGTPHLPQPGIC